MSVKEAKSSLASGRTSRGCARMARLLQVLARVLNDLIDARTLGRIEVERDLGRKSVTRDNRLRVSVGGKGGAGRHCKATKISVGQRLHPCALYYARGEPAPPMRLSEPANATTHSERAGWL